MSDAWQSEMLRLFPELVGILSSESVSKQRVGVFAELQYAGREAGAEVFDRPVAADVRRVVEHLSNDLTSQLRIG